MLSHIMFPDPSTLGETLQREAGDGNIERVRRLILQNADLDHRVNFSTPLSEAARGGHLAVVRLLLVGGANKDAVNVHTRPYAPATLLHPPLC